MRFLTRGYSSFRALAAQKLGVCPFCIRAAGLGVTISWAGAIALRIFWPQPLVLAAALVLAVAFSLLLLAHLVAYSVRVARELRDFQEGRLPIRPPRDYDASRRRFLLRVAQAGVGMLALSLLGPRAASAIPFMDPCAGRYNPDAENIGVGDDEAAAKANYEAMALSYCNGFCFLRECAAGSQCERVGRENVKMATKPVCHFDADRGFWICTGKVVFCECACQQCEKAAKPPWPQDGIAGGGPTKREAEDQCAAAAVRSCDDYCARLFLACPGPPECRRDPNQQVVHNCKCRQTGQNSWFCEGAVKRCNCRCT